MISAVFVATFLNADIYATTDNNKRVILKDNGRWEYSHLSNPAKKKRSHSSTNALNKYVYKNKDIKIFLKYIGLKKGFDVQNFLRQKSQKEIYNTEIILQVSSISKNKIISFNTHRVWGFDNGSDVGGTEPKYFTLKDSFNNMYSISAVFPESCCSRVINLRPKEVQEFKLTFKHYPLLNAKYLMLSIPSYSFGKNKEDIRIKIPISLLDTSELNKNK